MVTRPMQRIAIVNRGDAAVRLIQAVREVNAERGTELRTIALYTEPDRRSVFVRAADEAICIGPAMYTDPESGQRQHSYVDLPRLRDVLREMDVDSVWVGWGFVSERAEFADLCEELQIRFIGPSAEAIRLLGDKIASKRLAESLDIPVVPWVGPVAAAELAAPIAASIGYPILVKAAAGGGGRGIRLAADEPELDGAFRGASDEARSAFGDALVFLEKAVLRARHLEVQIAGDAYGGVWAVGVRDCTVQRRRQKIIEESASCEMDPGLEAQLKDWAVRLVHASGYTGVGTVEFLHDLDSSATYFMEVNTRLQVEHTVTEVTTGLDLVKLQLALAVGSSLEGLPPPERGAAVEARITAEDVFEGFRPAPGRIALFQPPAGPGVRVDTGITAGDVIPPEFDPLLLKVIASGRTRSEAIARLRRAIRETNVVVEGGASTVGFVAALLDDPAFRSQDVHVGWVDELVQRGAALVEDRSDLALILAAVELSERDRRADRARLFSTAARGRPELVHARGRSIELAYRGTDYEFTVHRMDASVYAIETPDGSVEVCLDDGRGAQRVGTCGGHAVHAVVMASGAEVQVDMVGTTYRCRSEQAGIVRAPSPSLVVQVRVSPGEAVRKGQVLVVLESMKLETSITSPTAGVVRDVLVMANSQVDAGKPMVYIEPVAATGAVAPASSVSFDDLALGEDPRSSPGADAMDVALRRLRGFEGGVHNGAEPDDPEPGDGRDLRLLELFAGCSGVTSRVRPVGERAGTAQPSGRETLFQFLRAPERSRTVLPTEVLHELERVLRSYGADGLEHGEPLEEALYRLVCAQESLPDVEPLVVTVLRRLLHSTSHGSAAGPRPALDLLQRLADVTEGSYPVVCDLARALVHRLYVSPVLGDTRHAEREAAEADLVRLLQGQVDDRRGCIDRLVTSAADVSKAVWRWPAGDQLALSRLEILLRRMYRGMEVADITSIPIDGTHALLARCAGEPVLAVWGVPEGLVEVAKAMSVELFLPRAAPLLEATDLEALRVRSGARRITATRWDEGDAQPKGSSVTTSASDMSDAGMLQGLHPAAGQRLELWRLQHFEVTHLASAGDVHLVQAVARTNPRDRRLVVLAGVHHVTDLVGSRGGEAEMVARLEGVLLECFAILRTHLAVMPVPERPTFNRIVLYVDGPWLVTNTTLRQLVRRLEPSTRNLGLEKVVARLSVPDAASGDLVDQVLHVTAPATTGMAMGFSAPSAEPIRPLSPRQQRVLRLRERGLRDPFELVDLLTARDATFSDFPAGVFCEHDLDEHGSLVPVERPAGENQAGIVVGVIENYTRKHPEGMRRVALFSDPSKGMGALAQPECARIVSALDLASAQGLPVEWFTVSSGARISMTSGTENLDWVARVLRRIVTFTQAGGEINVVVCGVNVGAQPYFNAEATMLMHTRGILIMTPQSSMVLTGKEALDFAGGVSADDNVGIGGYDRVMGPNGQAHYWAPSIEAACETLFRYYEHTYISPGERFPRPRSSEDAMDRDVTISPHPEVPWTDIRTVGDVFSSVVNPDRKKPFDMRSIMDAVVDADAAVMERWSGMGGAESVIVWDAHLGGHPVCLLGTESYPLPRTGVIPADGPDAWSAATLFPRSSKKLARAINSASGNRPVVVLANLAGFDGSPESLRKLQLEYGAEIGRAIINFQGPLVFCVVSRYHGGAFVVFSKSLHDNLEVMAVEGARASVIGGSAAAAVVFGRDVEARVLGDERVEALEDAWGRPDEGLRVAADGEREEVIERVRAEVRGVVAKEFDDVHSVDRARRVGSVDRVIAARELRPQLIAALERGRARAGVHRGTP